MKLEAIVLAEAVSPGDRGTLHMLGAGITRLTPPRFPWSEPRLHVVARLLLDDTDDGTTRQVQMRGVSPEGGADWFSPVITIITNEQIQETESGAEGELRVINLMAGINNASFPAPGRFDIVVSVDGEAVGRYPLILMPA
jgi:hypothetical protein